MLGLRDITNLTTPPLERLPIKTQLIGFDEGFIADSIRRELARDGQVFFVHNRVLDIENVAERVRRLVPEARVEIGHGQMPEGALEEVMLRFMKGETQVLVCTTIIESGIDVRRANTMFIDQAHMYGLAELHQLRGRVGRYHHQAFCFLIVERDTRPSEVAQKRLQAILKHAELGAGFKIAMKDLELRGAGNLLGAEQSGHIASIGYDLYCRLLDKAVRRLKNQPVAPDIDCALDLDVQVEIPVSYIKPPRQRLEAYRKLSRVRSYGEAERFARELTDRFGKPPRQLETAVMAAIVRSRLSQLGVASVSPAEGHLRFRCLSAPLTARKLAQASTAFRVLDETVMALPLRKGLETGLDQLRFLNNLLQSLARSGVFEEPTPGT
jgi:transcription-repair coupling factor (superfamily II helicase)